MSLCDVSRKRREHRKCAFQHPLLVAFWFKADLQCVAFG